MRRGSSSRPIPARLAQACALLAMVLVAACGSSGPQAAGGGAQVWALEDPVANAVLEKSAEAFNEDSETDAVLSTYVNDPYKQKLQVSMGSPQAPDIFFNWGGGNLAQYVEAGQVADMTGYLDKHPDFRDAFLPSVLDVGKINGRYYGLPMLGVQPAVLFYNEDVFERVGVSPPKTYADLLELVATFKAEGITPIALAGSQAWTELMWLEYLLDRVGGAEKSQNIVSGEDGAWSDPAVLEALRMCQELVKQGAFGSNYAAQTYDNGSVSTLLAKGEAAMHLMGTWELGTQLDNNPEFVNSGALGWTAFPTVRGGTGDPQAIVGNPSNYFSISASTDHKQTALRFLRETLASKQYVQGLIEAGQVPPVKGIEDELRGTKHADFTLFTYRLVEQAPTFTQSWDQALPPAVATELLTNLQQLFLLEVTPQQFVSSMEKAMAEGPVGDR